MLGYDVDTLPGATLPELFDAAAADGRWVITTSVRRLARAGQVRAIVVPIADAAAAVRRVTEMCLPAGPPWSRCARCNRVLQAFPSEGARGVAPDDIVARAATLWRCPSCRRWYWHGSHVDRMRAWLASALGRPIAGPAPAIPDDAGTEPGDLQ